MIAFKERFCEHPCHSSQILKMMNFKTTVLFFVIAFLQLFNHCHGEKVKLLTVNCDSPYLREESWISIEELKNLELQTTSTHIEVPKWLKLVCKEINCNQVVFKIDNCNDEHLLCYADDICQKFYVRKPIQIHTEVDSVDLKWYPNDRIM